MCQWEAVAAWPSLSDDLHTMLPDMAFTAAAKRPGCRCAGYESARRARTADTTSPRDWQ